jgi:hypothetical protein
MWAAFFNFAAFLVFGVHVAKTIGKGVVDPAIVTPPIILAAVLGALFWNLITWWSGCRLLLPRAHRGFVARPSPLRPRWWRLPAS